MDARNWLVTFCLFVLLLVFTFVFAIGSLDGDNTTYGILALVGFIVCIGASIFNSVTARHDGSALESWLKIYAAVAVIAFIWFLARIGSVFG